MSEKSIEEALRAAFRKVVGACPLTDDRLPVLR